MNKRLLSLMASLLLCGAVSAQSHFEADTHAQDNNMPVVAQVVLDGQTVTTGGYELGAFVGNATEARGSAQIQAGLDNTYWIQVYYNTETEENPAATVSFKLYDGEDEYTAETTLTIDPEGYGTPSEPLEIVVNRAITQTAQLNSGWTWWSTPIEMNGNNGLQQLESSISQYGVTIKSQTQSVIKRGNNWQGSLTSIQNEKAYKINVSNLSTAVITGMPANPSDHPITINSGWNWIGYPVNTQQSVASALSGITPSNGDVIKGQNGSALYRGTGWVPASYQLIPGRGYMYFSNTTTSRTIVFSNAKSIPDIKQDNPFWSPNIYAYEDNLVLVAVVYVGDDEQKGESLEVGAFVNGDCSGSSELYYVDDENRYYAILTVGGRNGDKIHFGMVNKNTGEIFNESDNVLVFDKDAILGDFDNPYEIHFNGLGTGSTSMQMTLYPNPVKQSQAFELNIPQSEVITDLVVINALGVIVRHDTGALKSTISGLPTTGVYYVKATCRSGNTYYGRLIVK